MARAIWTPLAETDLEEILIFIAEQGRPQTAEKINYEIRDKVAIYAETPDTRHRACHFGSNTDSLLSSRKKRKSAKKVSGRMALKLVFPYILRVYIRFLALSSMRNS